MITIYRHRRLDTNEVFYIGIGKTKKRAYSKHRRNPHWKNIVNKTNYSVEIIAEVDTWEDACELEQFLIQEYGRKDLGLGNLVNLTDGGDGSINPSEETKEKISLARKGTKHSEETKKKIGDAHRGELSHMYGKTLSDETRAKLSEAKKGESSPVAKKVINTETGVVYPTIKEASEKEGFKKTTLWAMLRGQNPNKTNLMLI